MSVVNDVLKNLNQRQAQHKMLNSISFVYREEKKSPIMWWLLVSLALLLSLLMALVLYFPFADNINRLFIEDIAPIELPDNLFMIAPSNSNNTPVGIHSTAHINITSSKKNETKPLVSKTQQTQALEVAMAGIKSGDTQQVKSVLESTPKSIQDAIKLRLMLKEQPDQVLPYIERHYKNFLNQQDLLAIAAQAQQRAGEHKSALKLYESLIRSQPQDARWRVGFAISLEASGHKLDAKKMYNLALNMPQLPPALKRFSVNRLSNL